MTAVNNQNSQNANNNGIVGYNVFEKAIRDNSSLIKEMRTSFEKHTTSIKEEIHSSINNNSTAINDNSADINELRKSIDNLSKAINATKRDATEDCKEDKKEGKKPNFTTWFLVIAVISVIALGLAITSFFMGVTPYVNWNVETVSLSIILAFVGILATFVVLSNYMQVQDIKREFTQKIEKLKNNFVRKTDSDYQLLIKIKDMYFVDYEKVRNEIYFYQETLEALVNINDKKYDEAIENCISALYYQHKLFPYDYDKPVKYLKSIVEKPDFAIEEAAKIRYVRELSVFANIAGVNELKTIIEKR
jgi:hypothetical protein